MTAYTTDELAAKIEKRVNNVVQRYFIPDEVNRQYDVLSLLSSSDSLGEPRFVISISLGEINSKVVIPEKKFVDPTPEAIQSYKEDVADLFAHYEGTLRAVRNVLKEEQEALEENAGKF